MSTLPDQRSEMLRSLRGIMCIILDFYIILLFPALLWFFQGFSPLNWTRMEEGLIFNQNRSPSLIHFTYSG